MKNISKLKKQWYFWKRRISAVLACIVVFVTVYAMVLPAITLDQGAADQEEGLVLEEKGTETEPDLDGTDQEEPGFSDEEDFGFEEEDTESHTEDTWAMTEGPVTLQWPAEPEDAEEAEEAVFYDESGEEIDYSVEATFGEDSGLPADVILRWLRSKQARRNMKHTTEVPWMLSEVKAGTRKSFLMPGFSILHSLRLTEI
jgi:flagellar biosynthesis/type III secretory pathway M-ring protein FliF/YscJ